MHLTYFVLHSCFVVLPLACALLLSGPTLAAAQTTVTAVVEAPSADERGPIPAIIAIRRFGDLPPMTVAYSLEGTASRDIDYLVWDRAEFDAGVDTVRIAVLPRNDALDDPDETVILNLLPGDAYTLGSPSSATVSIRDFSPGGSMGVWDSSDVDGFGQALVDPDLAYLDSAIVGQNLVVLVGFARPAGLITNVELFLDTDPGGTGGDYRAGHVGDQDYRIAASAGLFGGATVYKLPVAPPFSTPWVNPENETALWCGATTLKNGNYLWISIPTACIGNPTAVDLFVTSYSNASGAGAVVYRGMGDRTPDFGAFDTSTRQIVVRHPGRTTFAYVQDDVDDNTAGFDLRSGSFLSVAGQFLITLEFGTPFDPTKPAQMPGPRGELQLDADRSVATGAFPMGGDIATWGADSLLLYDIASMQAGPVLVQLATGSEGSKVEFGTDRNDGRWLADGTKLHIRASISVFDAHRLDTTLLSGPVSRGCDWPDAYECTNELRRVRSDGRMIVRGWTIASNFRDVGDALLDTGSALDMASARPVQAMTWDPEQRRREFDAAEYGMISGTDLLAVDAQITGDHLVVRGWLWGWANTDFGNLFEVWVDADGDTATAPLGIEQNAINGGSALGVDAIARVDSVTSLGDATTYGASILRETDAGFLLTRTDSILVARPSASANALASFTVTIPLRMLPPLGPQLRLYVTAGRRAGGNADIAPVAPLAIDVPAAPSPLQ